MICYCDMDGVLSDFVGGCCQHLNIANPYERKEMLGVWDFLESNDGMEYDFWRRLPKMPDADAIMGLLKKRFEHIYILTAPMKIRGCVDGKIHWLEEHFPDLDVIVTHHKHLLAKEHAVLIDDRDDNYYKFLRAGGKAHLVARPWNANHYYAEYCIDRLEKYLERL